MSRKEVLEIGGPVPAPRVAPSRVVQRNAELRAQSIDDAHANEVSNKVARKIKEGTFAEARKRRKRKKMTAEDVQDARNNFVGPGSE